MTRFQSVIVASTLVVCLGVGLWASQRTSRAIPVDSTEPSPLLLAVAEESLIEDQPGIVPAVATESAVSPRKLTTDDAAPVKDHPVRRTIDRLMPNASAEERQIWFEELQSLPVSAVEDLLRLRKESDLAAPLRSTPDPLPPVTNDLTDSIPSALRRYRAVLRHNLLNADTPGYRALRTEWLARPLDETNVSDQDMPEAWHLARLRIDTRTGELEETDRPLDLAIKGEGWFVVEDEDGEHAFTRYGALQMNDKRELELPAIPASRSLSPRIAIPEGTAQLFIDGNGAIYGGAEFGKWTTEQPLGQIRLARFFDDSALVLHKDGLYHPTPAAGTMTRCIPGEQCGSLESGFLEKSNVDRESQERAMERIKKWLERQALKTP